MPYWLMRTGTTYVHLTYEWPVICHVPHSIKCVIRFGTRFQLALNGQSLTVWQYSLKSNQSGMTAASIPVSHTQDSIVTLIYVHIAMSLGFLLQKSHDAVFHTFPLSLDFKGSLKAQQWSKPYHIVIAMSAHLELSMIYSIAITIASFKKHMCPSTARDSTIGSSQENMILPFPFASMDISSINAGAVVLQRLLFWSKSITFHQKFVHIFAVFSALVLFQALTHLRMYIHSWHPLMMNAPSLHMEFTHTIQSPIRSSLYVPTASLAMVISLPSSKCSLSKDTMVTPPAGLVRSQVCGMSLVMKLSTTCRSPNPMILSPLGWSLMSGTLDIFHYAAMPVLLTL